MVPKCIQRSIPFSAILLLSSALHGQVSFFQPPSYAGSGNLYTADFNGDGKADLLSGDGTLQLGSGNGTFNAGTHVTGLPLAVADFNGDGKPDVLELGNGTIQILLGIGDGTFQPAIATASGASLGTVGAIDLNGDGKADVVGIFNTSLVVYLSKGDGTFAGGISNNLGQAGTTQLSFDDFNADGKTDVLANMDGTNVAGQAIVLLGNGDGTFQAARTSPGVYYADGIAVSDLNGDGKLDLAMNSSTFCTVPDCSSTVPGGIYLLVGNGDGTFQPPALVLPSRNATSSPTYPSHSLAAADINGDGKTDLILEGSPTVAQLFLGHGDGTFASARSYILSLASNEIGNPSGLLVADFNGDGKLDVAAGNAVLLGKGNDALQGIPLGTVPFQSSYNQVAPPPPAVTGYFSKAAYAPGVAVSSGGQTNAINILSNDGSGLLTLTHSYTLSEPAENLGTADFNSDGNLDLLVFGIDPITQVWSYGVLLGNGDGTFQPEALYPQPGLFSQGNVSTSLLVADFNKDNKPDVAIGGVGNNSLAILLGKGDGTFAGPTYVFDGGASYVMSADFNGDGNLDIAAGQRIGTAETALLLGNGDGTFQAATFPPSLNGFGAEYIASLTTAGKADLVSNNQVAIGNGDGTFTISAIPSNISSIYGVADLNGDGIADLLGIYGNQTGLLLGNGDGTFASVINVPQNGVLPSELFLTDMNGDGRPDIVFPWLSAVSGIGVIPNQSPANFSILVSALSPSSVVAGAPVTSTITLNRGVGFTGTVTLACTGLPPGAACALTPNSLSGSMITASLTISTTSSTLAGTYAIQVLASSGSLKHQAALSLEIQTAPDFTIAGPSTSSQTISAGQSATFNLSLAPVGAFTGTISFACAITPAATPTPTCSLSNQSLQFTDTAAQTLTVTMKTVAPVTTSKAPSPVHSGFPPVALPVLGLLLLPLLRKRKQWRMLAVLLLAAVCAGSIGCGSGSSSTTTHITPGTPANTYQATVTATSGSVTHTTTLQVKVQ